MGRLAAETIAALRAAAETGAGGDDVGDTISVAADLLRKVRDPGYRTGGPDVDAANVTPAEADDLKRALLDLLRRHPESEHAGRLVWALGNCGDPAHAADLVAQLERGVRQMVESNGLVFQALCALDNLGEVVFERDDRGGSSQSLLEVEKNLRQARAYLERRGVRVPW
jgi:hypothetical protein